jgi:hypothetical protein
MHDLRRYVKKCERQADLRRWTFVIAILNSDMQGRLGCGLLLDFFIRISETADTPNEIG